MPKRTFKVDKDIYDIDEAEVSSFLKDVPNAVEMKSFVVDKDTFDIPLTEVDGFLRDMPNAKPAFAEKKKFGLEDFNKKYGTSYTPQEFGGQKPSQLKSPSTSTKTPTTTTPKAEKPDASLLKSYEVKLKEKKELLAPFESKAKELDARLEEYNKIAKNNNNQLPPKQYAEYKAIADERNALTEQYKKFYSEYTQLADKYNVEFKNYNAKIGEFNKGIEALNAQAKKAQEAESKRKFDELQKLGRNPAQRIKLYTETQQRIQQRIPQLVEAFNVAEQSGNAEEAAKLQELINIDSQKLKTFDQAIQGQKQLAAMNEPDTYANNFNIGIYRAVGASLSIPKAIDKTVKVLLADIAGLPEGSVEAYMKNVYPIEKPLEEKLASIGKFIVKNADERLADTKVNRKYEASGWNALQNGDIATAAEYGSKDFTSSLATSLMYMNPATATIATAGMFGDELNQLEEQNIALTSNKLLGAAGKAALELVTERMFGAGKAGIKLIERLGKDAAERVVKETTEEMIKKSLPRKIVENIGEEIISEEVNTIGSNAIDIYINKTKKPDQILDGVGETFVTTLFGGGIQGGATTTITHYVDRLKLKEYEAKKEQALQLQEQALEAPSEVVAEAIEVQAAKLNAEADAIAEENNEIGANADPEIIAELQQENADLDELEAALPEAPPEVQEAIQAQIEEKTKVVEKLTKEARVSALERLKVAEEEIKPQDNEEITTKEEKVEPVLGGLQPNRDEEQIGQESTELRTNQEGETQVEAQKPILAEEAASESKEGKTFTLNNSNTFYHASSAKRKGRLKPNAAEGAGEGVYFSTNKDLVKNEFGDYITEVKLNITNPLYTNSEEYYKVIEEAISTADKKYGKDKGLKLEEGETYFRYDPTNYSEIQEIGSTYLSNAAKKLGYDAIIDKNSSSYENEILVLDESKIIYPEDEKISKEQNLQTNKPQEDAIKSGKIEQSSESERKGVTEQKQGEQEDRVNQEEPITKGQASPSGSDSVSEGGQEQEVKGGLTLYHGSPHSFGEFDISKLGSGEGAQAFGWGLYFTNDAGIAKSYANVLGSKKNFWEALSSGRELSLSKSDYTFINEELDSLGFDGSKAESEDLGDIIVDGKTEYNPAVLDAMSVLFGKNARKELEGYDLTPEQIDRLLEIKKTISNPQFYNVSIDKSKTNFIEWEGNLTDAQINQIGENFKQPISGKEAYEALSKKLGGDKKASLFLLSKGIDGIVYKSKKGTGGETGKSRNYVIFDSKSVSVNEINEKPIKQKDTESGQEQEVKPKPKKKKVGSNKAINKLSDPQSKRDFIALALFNNYISTDSFNKASDKNNLKVDKGEFPSLRINYLRRKGMSINELVDNLMRDKKAFPFEMTEDALLKEVINFMLDNPKGANSYAVQMLNVPDAEQEYFDLKLAEYEQQLAEEKLLEETTFVELEQAWDKIEEDVNALTEAQVAEIEQLMATEQEDLIEQIIQENNENIRAKERENQGLSKGESGTKSDKGKEKQSLEEEVKKAKSKVDSANVALSKAKSKMTAAAAEYQKDIFGGAKIEGKLFPPDLKAIKKDIEQKEIDLYKAKEAQEKAIAKLDAFVEENQQQLDLADKAISFLENLKADTKGKGFDAVLGIPIGIWNATIDTIILGVKAGRVISEVVQEAIDYINANHGKFDEKAFKDMLVEGGVVTEDELVVEGEPNIEETAKKSGISVKNLRDLYNVNRELFGLDRVKSLASAIAMDRMIGTMAKRAGITKSEMYGKLKFEKASEEFVKGLSERGKVLYQIVGNNANLSENVKQNLSVARDMELEGKDAKTIRIATGWEKGKDGKWKYEIADLKFTSNGLETLKESATLLENGGESRVMNIGDIIANDELFNLYPQLRNIKVLFQDTEDYEAGYAKTKGGKEFISISLPNYVKRRNEGNTMGIIGLLSHELQHAIQGYEGFARGTSQNERIDAISDRGVVKELLDKGLSKDEIKKQILDSSFEEYRKAAGEVEARNVQNRMGMTQEQRRETLLSETEDVARDEQIVFFQKTDGKAQGAAMIATDGSAVIYALTDPNVSTPLHELAHVFEHYLTDAEKYSVIKSAGTKVWNEQTSEYFARGFEKYLADGKAPSQFLAKIFEKFKTWLTDIYKGIKGSDIDIELNDEMRSIYSQMLGQEIEGVAEVVPPQPPTEPKKEEGEGNQKKSGFQERSIEQAEDEVVKQIARDNEVYYTAMNQKEEYERAKREFPDAQSVSDNFESLFPENVKLEDAARLQVRRQVAMQALSIEVSKQLAMGKDPQELGNKINRLQTALATDFAKGGQIGAMAVWRFMTPEGIVYQVTQKVKEQNERIEGRLSEAQKAELADLESKVQELQAKLQEEIAKTAERKANKVAKKQPKVFSETKKKRKEELKEILRKKMFGQFNDVSNIARILFDKDTIEYAKLVVEEGAIDFNSFVSEMVKDFGKQIKPILPELYKKVTGEDLLDAESKRQMEAYLQKQFTNAYGKSKIPSKKSPKRDIEKILEGINSGVLGDEFYKSLFLEKFGMRTNITIQEAAKLRELAQAVTSLPPTSKLYNIAVLNMAQYINNLYPINFFSDLADTWVALNYAQMLSGVSTHILNIFSTGFGILNSPFRNATNLSKWYKAIREGVKDGSFQTFLAYNPIYESTFIPAAWIQGIKVGKDIAMDTMISGATTDKYIEGLVNQSGNVKVSTLEQDRYGKGKRYRPIRLFGVDLNPYNKAKYIGRSLAAEDALMFQTAYEAELAGLALSIYREKGLRGKRLSQAVVDAFTQGKVNMEAINEQLEAEVAILNEAGITVNERVKKIRRSELMADKVLLEMGATREQVEGVTKLASSSTFTDDRNGVISRIANLIGAISNKNRAAQILIKPFVPFTKVVANVTETALDAAPIYGFLRANNLGITGWTDKILRATGHDGISTAAMGTRGSQEYYEQMSRAWQGTIAFATLLSLFAHSGDEDDDYEDTFLQLTGGYSEETRKNKSGRTNITPKYTIRVGDVKISYLNIPVLQIPMALIGNYNDYMNLNRYSKQELDERMGLAIAYAATQTMTMTKDMSFVQGVEDLTSTIYEVLTTEEKKAEKALKALYEKYSSFLLKPLPQNNNMLLQIEKFFDPISYSRKEISDITAYALGVQHIYGKPSVDIFGEAVKSYPAENTIPYTHWLGLITQDKDWKFLSKYNAIQPKLKNEPSKIFNSEKGEYEVRTMTADEFYKYASLSGKIFKKKVQDYQTQVNPEERVRETVEIADKEVNALNNDINKLQWEAKEEAKAQLFLAKNVDPNIIIKFYDIRKQQKQEDKKLKIMSDSITNIVRIQIDSYTEITDEEKKLRSVIDKAKENGVPLVLGYLDSKGLKTNKQKEEVLLDLFMKDVINKNQYLDLKKVLAD